MQRAVFLSAKDVYEGVYFFDFRNLVHAEVFSDELDLALHYLAKDGHPTAAENSTVTRKITDLRSFFSFLQSYGYRGANPAHPDFVKAPRYPTKD